MRSRRTVSRGSGDRSWFGRPQAIKKGDRECRHKRGRMRQTCWRPSGTTLFKQAELPWLPFTNCQKKRSGPTRSQFDASSPHRREQSKGDGKNTYWSSPLRPNDSRGQQTKRREGSLPLPFDASPPFTKTGASIRSFRYETFRYQQKHSLMKNPWVP